MDIKTLEAAYYAAREERENGIYDSAAEAAFLAMFSNMADAKAWEATFVNHSNFTNSHEWWYKELTPIF